MWHLPGTWWWNAKRSLTCCHVCVKQGNVCLCLICVSYVFLRQAPYPYMDTYCTCHHFISRHKATRKPAALSVSPLIYLFIYLLIDPCSFSTSWDSSAAFPCRTESSLGFDILRNVPRHFCERRSSSVGIANTVGVSRIESRKARMKKKLHPSGGRHFLMARGRLVYQAGPPLLCHL